jgi:hypothetical protein
MIVAAIVEPDRLTELRGDAISSLAYVANWHFIFEHRSYFDQFQRPSLFRHLWSLGELFLVNDHAPVSWQDESNHALEEADETWPHPTLIDWAPVAAAHQNLLWDGIHLTPGGAGIYARLVARAVQMDLITRSRRTRGPKS